MIFDLPPKLWVPPKPAIIRPAPPKLLRPEVLGSFLPGMFPAGAAAVAAQVFDPSSVTYVTQNGSTANQASYTFSSQSIGSAAAGRRVIFGIKSQAQAIVTATLGGNAMTLLYDSTSGSDKHSFWEYDIDTGTTASVVFSTSGSNASNIRFGVWNVFGGSPTPYDEDTTTSHTSGTFSFDLTCPDDSIIIAIGSNADGAGASAQTWGGVMTERFDVSPEGATQRAGGADATIASGGAQTVSFTATVNSGTFGGKLSAICI